MLIFVYALLMAMVWLAPGVLLDSDGVFDANMEQHLKAKVLTT